MFWYKVPNKLGIVKTVDAESKQEAKKILKAIGIKKPIILNEEDVYINGKKV